MVTVVGRALVLHPHGRHVAGRWMRHWSIQTGCLVARAAGLAVQHAVSRDPWNRQLWPCPPYVTVAGAVLLLPLSPLLIFGWGPLPGLGIAGGAIALLLYYLAGGAVLPPLVVAQFAAAIAARSAVTVGTVCEHFACGLGGRSVTVYNQPYQHHQPWWCLRHLRRLQAMAPHHGWVSAGAAGVRSGRTPGGHGRHLHRRQSAPNALRATWIGAAIAFRIDRRPWLVGCSVRRRLSLFNTEPAKKSETGSRYLRIVGPWYGFFGLGACMSLSRGQDVCCGRCLQHRTFGGSHWPGWLALHGGYAIAGVFAARPLPWWFTASPTPGPLPVARGLALGQREHGSVAQGVCRRVETGMSTAAGALESVCW